MLELFNQRDHQPCKKVVRVVSLNSYEQCHGKVNETKVDFRIFDFSSFNFTSFNYFILPKKNVLVSKMQKTSFPKNF